MYFGGSSNHLSRAPNEGAVFSDLYARTKYLSEIHESQTITLCAELRAPNEGAVFSDLYARTKYLSEIHESQTITLCAELPFCCSSGLKMTKCRKIFQVTFEASIHYEFYLVQKCLDIAVERRF